MDTINDNEIMQNLLGENMKKLPYIRQGQQLTIDILKGPRGEKGEKGEDGKNGQITNIKGKKDSLEDCLGLEGPLLPGDAYVVETSNGEVNLYVYVGGNHNEAINWVTLRYTMKPDTFMIQYKE